MQHDFHKIEERAMGTRSGKQEEQREMTLWDKWVDDETPDTFGFLELAKDGGFSEVKDLYTSSRWGTAAILIVFVVYNVVAIMMLDYAFMTDPRGAAESLGTELENINKFYFSRDITNFIAPHFGYTGDQIPSPMKVIGFLELVGLAFFCTNLVYCLIMARFSTGFRKWFAVQTIFWDILPTLSVYSAMRLLYIIVPAVLSAKVTAFLAAFAERKEEKKSMLPLILSVMGWLFALVFSFIVGFDTFLMKLRVVSAAANKKNVDLTVLLATVQFLVQVLGVVQLSSFVRKRLFIFIFGGEDGILQDEEVVLMETWNALLAKRMYRDLDFWQATATMASFSDEDFQSLVLNENKEVKKANIGE